MVRMTCHAGCLTAALIASVGLRFTEAPAAGPQPNRPVSIVAQSTKGTAGTGRRPIGERIAASNLPVRTPAAVAPLSPAIPEAPEPSEPEVAEYVPEADGVDTIAPSVKADLAAADTEEVRARAATYPIYNDIIRARAAHNDVPPPEGDVPLVELALASSLVRGSGVPADGFEPDGLHLTASGQAWVAEQVFVQLNRVGLWRAAYFSGSRPR